MKKNKNKVKSVQTAAGVTKTAVEQAPAKSPTSKVLAKVPLSELKVIEKTIPVKETIATDATKAAISKKVAEARDVDYIYPADCTTAGAKKKFRTACRGKIKTLKSAIAKCEKAEDAKGMEKAAKELNDYLTTFKTAKGIEKVKTA